MPKKETNQRQETKKRKCQRNRKATNKDEKQKPRKRHK